MSATPVERLNAALEGRYRIESELGEGGMATVYLADDLKHERKVALKVLKPELAAVVGAERFLAEIKTTANLQHPHILPLFDSGAADGFLFYVMPYVEGETLRDRLDRDHQLPVDEAVGIATAVANALDYAHRRGVIHRDIKPANILMHDGQPVISDFGIALAVGTAGQGRLTETGLSVGTPHYMSPEQATGDLHVGAATDIYAVGCVLYEMLVGEPPYTGSTAQAILGRIIAGDAVSATQQRALVPAHVDAAIRKSLEKLPADRFTSAHGFAEALADAGFRHGEQDVVRAVLSGRGWRAAAVAGLAGGLLLGAAGTALLSGDGEAPPAGVVRFEIEPANEVPLDFIGTMQDLAVSTDGGQIVYKGSNAAANAPLLNLQSLEQLGAAPVRGAEGGIGPFFSADGAWVGFTHFQDGQSVSKVATLGGAPVALGRAPATIRGASWGSDDQIVLGTQSDGLFRVSGGGGEVERLTTLANDELTHRWPFVIEGRDAVLFTLMTTPTDFGQLAVLDLRSTEVARLGISGTSPRYVPTGHLIYAAEDGSLRAVAFDVRTLEVTGSPVPLVEGVLVKTGGAANFDVSVDGRLVYTEGSDNDSGLQWELVWVDQEGRAEPLPMPARAYQFPAVSPDGGRVAVSVIRGAGQDLWVFDVATGAGLRLTHDDETNWIPTWSPDGERIFFSSTKDAPRPTSFVGVEWYGNVYVVPADGSAEPVRVTTSEENQGITGITPDGRTLVYSHVYTNADHWEIMALPADGSAEATPLVAGPYRRGSGTISPDGRWLAYRSDESGAFEVFVEPFPGPGAKVPASIGGGTHPGWSADSRELFYRGADGMMMAATILGDGTPRVSERRALFSHQSYRIGGGYRLHDEAPDGRFLMMRSPGSGDGAESSVPRITVVLNWFEELRARVPN